MHSLNLPAGASLRINATARPDWGLHRWGVRVLDAASGAPRLAYGSQIGGRDLDQRIEIPPQDVDCRLEVQSSHDSVRGWIDDRTACLDDTPDRLLIGFCDAARPGSLPADVLLTFSFGKSAAHRRASDLEPGRLVGSKTGRNRKT